MVPSDVEDVHDSILPTEPMNGNSTNMESLKRQLIELCATYDRGFGASTTARQTINMILQQLQSYHTTPTQQQQQQQQQQQHTTTTMTAATTMTVASPTSIQNTNNKKNDENHHGTIVGNWRMIYTTALDVLSLQASPFFMVGAIYQVYTAPTTTTTTTTTTTGGTVINIIDFIPRFQSLFFQPNLLLPSSSWNWKPPNTLLRVQVSTRACVPKEQQANRIGLIFDSVSIQPIEVLGLNSTMLSSLFPFLPPPLLSFDLPKLPTFGTTPSSSTSSSSSSVTTATGYFDVTYLDEELLIIQQNAPGGIFCLLRTNTIDP
jgi:hypothetical protein